MCEGIGYPTDVAIASDDGLRLDTSEKPHAAKHQMNLVRPEGGVGLPPQREKDVRLPVSRLE